MLTRILRRESDKSKKIVIISLFSESDYVWPICVEAPEQRGTNTCNDKKNQG
jgi:hypothetical protein